MGSAVVAHLIHGDGCSVVARSRIAYLCRSYNDKLIAKLSVLIGVEAEDGGLSGL